MTPVELSRTLLHAVRRAVDDGKLTVTVPERVVVAPPGPGGCGDYASNLALQLARPAKRPPREVADTLRSYLLGVDGISDVVVTGPGFLNLALHAAAPGALVAEVLRRGPRYGHIDRPDGPSHRPAAVVHLHCPRELRALVVTDSVARLLRAQGILVRTSCAAPPPEEWAAELGVRVDVIGEPAAPGVTIRPVPVTIRPTPAPNPVAALALGRDAGRWALLHPAPHDRPRTGTGEHLVQRESNPLFRVRYAHARTRALLRNAAELGFAPEPGSSASAATGPLTALLADHPRLLAAAAREHAPDRLARHLVAVADAALSLLPAVLPLGDEKPSAAHRARLALAEAAGAVLAGGLCLLGIDAPDHL
ncbi:ArgS-related anticodon-binding protein NrtL [Streptomyces sp. NPDC023723]|uniref:ArgS-related anticodon-binding protein NrtL n=1 Tax=Streptomyces sp. NPDC023723 TaxID=3154323 RepID=UPI0033EDA308